MRYEVITDSDGYVQVIRHTGTPSRDFVELNLADYNFDNNRMYAYKLGKDELIFDADKYEIIHEELVRKEDQKQIAILEQQLAETDYIGSKWADEVMQLTDPLTFQSDLMKINSKFETEYRDVLEQREAWRKEIEELEDSV